MRAPLVQAGGQLLGLLLLVLAGALGIARHMPPPPLPADAPGERFSAGRALRDVEAIAQAPHPSGSAEHARVRAYLVARLHALGFDAEVQQTLAVSRKYASAMPVANIVARRKGSGTGKAVMLVAHYDSVPMGPGASDDGAGVAAVLETARWLGTQPAFRNDVILLLSDGEEFGLAGAEGFVAAHPWAKDVGLVVNLEARGHAGPAILFETSAQNAALIAGVSAVMPSAVANSLTYEVYKRLPNDTDFTVFKRAGLVGVNIAYLQGVTHYHSAQDTPGNVDRASLQHHGEYLAALLTAFGNAELPLPRRDDAVYFNAPWGGLAHYAPAAALPLAGFGALLVAGLMVQARRRGELGAWRFGLALLRVLALLVGAAALGGVLWAGLRRANPNFHWLSNGDGYHTDFLMYGLIALLGAGALAFSGRGPADRAACWSPWALLALASAALLPGASWLFAWPLLAGAAGELAAQADGRRSALWRALGLAPLAFFVVPLVWLLFVALGPSLLAGIAVLAMLAMLPLAALIGNLRGPAAYAALMFVGLGLTGTGLARSGFGPDAKKPNHVIYLLERTGEPPSRGARWLAADEETDAWTGQFLGAHPQLASVPSLAHSQPLLQADAPVLDLPVPQAGIVADEVRNGTRQLTLHVETHANVLALLAEGESEVRAIRIGGQTLFDATDGLPLRRVQLVAPSAGGSDLQFELAPGSRLDLQVLQQFWGLPDAHEVPHVPRAGDMMTTPHRQADSRYTLDHWSF